MDEEQLRTTDGPTMDRERIDSLDVLRGVALLGILVMNIQSFSMPSLAYLLPEMYGTMDDANLFIWYVSHIFFDLKFMTMFSIMFGAGIVLMSQHRDAANAPVLSVHYRRMALLLFFGLVHAYVIWYGDILTPYAICGCFVVFCRKWRPRSLMFIGAVLLVIGSLFFGLVSVSVHYSEEVAEAMRTEYLAAAEELATEIEAYRGAWTEHVKFRAVEAARMQFFLIPLVFFWRLCGLMCVGMALFKWGVLSAKRSTKFYLWAAVICGGIGIPLNTLGAQAILAHESDPAYVLGIGSLKLYYVSLPMAFMWISLVMLLCKSGAFVRMKHVLACYGRMAFTNYIGQSLMATWIFYGYGLGWFGSVSRVEQAWIVLAIWAIQLTISLIWLKYFKFGPLEWVWRSGVYLKPQPMVRTGEHASATTA